MAVNLVRLSTLMLLLGSLLAACGGPQEQDGADQEVDTLAVEDAGQEGGVVNVGGRLFSIPSPVQTALAIRKSGTQYQKDLTMPLDKVDAVTGKTGQALLLGVFGADMAYVTVHGDGQRSLATLQAIEKLGSRMQLSNAFDRALLDRFRNNLGNEDSLLRFSGTAFRAADEYLKNNDSEDISALVLAGGWVESLHLVLADQGAIKDKSLTDRIGEQKNTLDRLVELIASTDAQGDAKDLLTSLKELQAEMAGITTVYTFEKPVTDAERRTTFINSTTSTTIPPDRFTAIAAKVAAIRSMILA